MTAVLKGSVVAVMAEGKQQALAVGYITLSTEEIKESEFKTTTI